MNNSEEVLLLMNKALRAEIGLWNTRTEVERFTRKALEVFLEEGRPDLALRFLARMVREA